MDNIVFLNGKFIDKSEASISIMDRGFLFGDGVYELIPVYKSRIFLLDKHLARHSIASLGLDTFAFNGCTTSTFGLWAGMPILTKIGESFAARFTASLLNSMGVNELITHSKDEYEEVALRLANDPNELLELKYKIKQSINTSPLFNSELFTRDLETKYIELVNSHSF